MKLKKILSLLLAMTMLFSCVGIPAIAMTWDEFVDQVESGDGSIVLDGNIFAGVSTEESLKNAIKEGGSITLGGDIELTAPIVVSEGVEVEIDLKGYTLSYNSTTQGEAMITNKGILTIDDSVGNGVINYNYAGDADSTYSKGNYTISNAGTLTVDGGKITIANLRGHAKYPIDNNSTTGDAILVINGGHLYNYNTSAIRQFCNSSTYENSVTINGGLIEGYNAIWVQNPGVDSANGSLSITDGEIKTTAAAYVSGTAELKDVSSGIYCTLNGDVTWSDDSAISITGGEINENIKLSENAPADITVDEAICNGNVELPVDETAYVAAVNGVHYETFADAVAAAQAGDTITLFDDVKISTKFTVNKAITLDGNGHSIIADDTAVWYTVSGKLSIKKYNTHLISVNADKVTLENIVLDNNSNAAGINVYCSQNVVFDNVSIINATKGMAALTVNGSTLTFKNKFETLGNSIAIDISNGTGVTSNLGVTVEEGTVFNLADKTVKFADVAVTDVSGAVNADGEAYFVAMDSGYYYTENQINSRTTAFSNGMTLLDDIELTKEISIKSKLVLNGNTLTIPEDKALKIIGNTTIKTAGGTINGKLNITSVDTTITAEEGLAVVTTVEGYKVVYSEGKYSLSPIVYVPALAKLGDTEYATVADALAAAQEAGMTDITITLVGETTKDSAIALEDVFNLYTVNTFDSVTFKQENSSVPYYIAGIYTGSRTNGGEFIFDGVNIIVTDQYILEGNVKLTNNSVIKSVAEANCFIYNGETTIEPGSKIYGVIEDFRGGKVVIDGGRTDGGYNQTPDMQDAIMVINWSGDSLTLKNGAYLKINSANEVGRLTINAGASLNVNASKAETCEYIVNNGTINIDVNSLINTKKITGTGKIVIDASAFDGEDVVLINADMSGFTGTVEVVNNSDAEYKIENGKLTLSKREVIGSVTFGYAENYAGYGRIWGQATANARESFALKLYSGEKLIATTMLNDRADGVTTLIDGKVHERTWSFLMDASQDAWWITTWEPGQPSELVQPDRVVLVVDGVEVSENVVKMTSPDNLKAVEWKDLVGVKKAVLPEAEVKNLGAISVTANEGDYTFGENYYEYDLLYTQKLTTATAPFDINIAMQFMSKDSAEAAKANAYADYTTDFFIKIDGLANGSFVGDGCYLAGYYPSFGAWVKIPLDGFTVANDKVYPVITSAGFDFSYVDICTSVENFICGIYLTPEIIEANPDINVNLTLGLSESLEKAQNAEFKKVDDYTYTAKDFIKLSGSGTEEDPFLIKNIDDLILFRNSVNSGDTTYNAENVWVALDADIDMAGIDWSVNIGDDCNFTFDGIFDGKNHTISNLTSVETAQKSDGYVCTGLFGAIYGSAQIKNLTIKNATINTGDFTGNSVGVVAGFAYSVTGSIENVNVIGNISIDAPKAYAVGTIIGYAYYGNPTIKDCSVKANAGSYIKASSEVAGIVGYGGAVDVTGSSVENLTITAEGLVGGIAGLLFEGGSVDNTSVKDVALVTTKDLWVNSAAIAVGTIASDGITVSAVDYSNVTANNTATDVMVGSAYTEKPTAVVPAVQAKIDDKYYTTLTAAIAAAQAGDTITVIDDIVLENTVNIPAGKEIVLDLAGKTISQTKEQTAGYQMILNDGSLTIKDSVGGGKISYTDSGNGGEYISDTIYNRGTLVVNGGTIENLSSSTVATNGYPHAVDTYSGIRNTSVTINGGTVYCAEYSAIRMFCVSATNTADLTITGGTIKGAVDMQNGTAKAAKGSLKVTGGIFETTKNANNIRFANWNGGAAEYGITASIEGGTFNGGLTKAYVPAAANWNSKVVSGGTFDVKPEDDFAAEGYEFTANAEGKYEVTEKAELFEFYTTTVTLANSLAINFYVKRDYIESEGCYAVVEHDLADGTTKSVEIPYTEWGTNTNGYYAITYSGLVAVQMADEIRVVIYNSDGVQISKEKVDGIRAYAIRGFNKFTDPTLLTALADMLNYGAAAQIKFNYNVDDLATVGAEDFIAQYASEDITVENIQEKGENYLTTTLSLENNILLTGYFRMNDITGKTATIEYVDIYNRTHSTTVTSDKFVKNSETIYGICVDDLAIADAGCAITITVYNQDGTVYGSLVDSMNSYLYRIMQKDDSDIYKMVAKFTSSAAKTLD